MSDQVHDRVIARAVHEWASGWRDHIARVVFAETAEVAEALAPRLRQQDALFSPRHSKVSAGSGLVVRFDGEFREPGDELLIEGLKIELQDYTSAAFIDVLQPTLVRLFDERGVSALLEDFDLAHKTGVLPPHLTDRRIQLADRAALVCPFETSSITSVYARADGELFFGAEGVPLGHSGSVWGTSALPRIAALSGITGLEAMSTALASRPWLPRMVMACELEKALDPDAGGRVNALAQCFTDDGRGDTLPLARDPFLLRQHGEILLADLVTLRRHRVDASTATVIEIVQTSSTPDLATDRIASALATTSSVAFTLFEQATAQLGVHLGEDACAAAASSLPQQ